MSSPTIPDLPVATIADDSDQMLLRQPAGALGTDKSVSVEKIRNINVSGLPTLSSPVSAQASDLMLIARGGVNYQIRHDQISFPSGTKMWFYHNAVADIAGWSLVSAGDSLLAVKGGSTYVSGGQEAGTWQQLDHTLTIAQIPSHSHIFRAKEAGQSDKSRGGRGSSTGGSDFNYTENTAIANTGGGGGHNHGSAWRPKSNVGIICVKG